MFKDVDWAPVDPILGITEGFLKDTNPNKVNLGVGVYQNREGKYAKLDVVVKAEKVLTVDAPASYLPIDGLKDFNLDTQKLIFGLNAARLLNESIATIQTPGGTAAVRLGADCLKKFFPGSQVWISDPSWENHKSIFEAVGFTVHTYPYYDANNQKVAFEALVKTLSSLPKSSIILLHAACHNPTGYDLTPEQWKEICKLCQKNGLIPFLDFAYQGLGDGLEEDAFTPRLFESEGLSFLTAYSYSKSFGLYSERVGALNIVTQSSEEAKRILTHVKRVVRTLYSSPPSHGARIVHAILSSPELRSEWEKELGGMRERIKDMRAIFADELAKKVPQRDFAFVTRQRGMFSFSGLSKDTIIRLREEKSIYAIESGRICVAALNEKNLSYVTDSIASVL